MLSLSFAYCVTYFLIFTDLEIQLQINSHRDLVLRLFSGLLKSIIETFKIHLKLEVFFLSLHAIFFSTRASYAVLSPSSPFQFGEISKFHHFTSFPVQNHLKNTGFNNCLHKTSNNLPLYIKKK